MTKFTKHSFTLPLNINPDSIHAYQYLAGAHKFKVAQIEAYKVTFIDKKA